MMISERQIKGIIALCIILALIPFIRFITPSRMDSKSPVLSTSGNQTLIMEVVDENGSSGIFFVESGTSVNQMFSQLAFNRIIKEDIKLKNGMKVRLVPENDHRGTVIEKMEASKRLALGLPVDVNRADFEELKLIPGIGDTTAANIVAGREEIGRFEKLEQLMEIKGIKERKLSQLRQYFYIDTL